MASTPYKTDAADYPDGLTHREDAYNPDMENPDADSRLRWKKQEEDDVAALLLLM